MTHRLQPVHEGGHGRFDSTAPWLVLLALVLLLALFAAFLAPGRLAAPAPTTPAIVLPSAQNPELGAFVRFGTARKLSYNPALLAHNPEVRLLAPYQRAAALADAALLAENPELSAYRRYQRP